MHYGKVLILHCFLLTTEFPNFTFLKKKKAWLTTLRQIGRQDPLPQGQAKSKFATDRGCNLNNHLYKFTCKLQVERKFLTLQKNAFVEVQSKFI